MPLLEIRDLVAGYGSLRVLRGVSLAVEEGEIVTLLGANGAGKTTTLCALSGLLQAPSGSVRFAGRELLGRPAHTIAASGLLHVPEGRRIFSELSVLENLELGAYTRNDTAGIRRDMDHAFALFPILKERLSQPGGTLSGGEQQMLAIGRALMARPRMLLLDEPSLGLAPLVVHRIFEVIRALNREGVTVLLVEQNAAEALSLATRAYVMETGSITLSGKASDLLRDPRVKEAYLGEG